MWNAEHDVRRIGHHAHYYEKGGSLWIFTLGRLHELAESDSASAAEQVLDIAHRYGLEGQKARSWLMSIADWAPRAGEW